MNLLNGEDEEKNTETVTELDTTRIFVGGLGVTVTAEDINNTFGNLGKINNVEIIRTKGRSLAYLDFIPYSQKCIAKLFSMYNGCMWKGGRLKLEKAKEHYLLRLKKERSEDAELANNTVNDAVVATKSIDSLENLTKMINPKISEIRLFFPKLRKLRPLPFNGTGKHKYSFQRIEVPALPIHFCDCDEHSKPLYSALENKLFVHEAQDGGIDEKELSIMESVMNKLFEREDKSKAEISRHKLVNEKEKAPEPVVNLALYDNEEDENVDEDDGNLVMNMVAMGNVRNGSLKSWRQEKNIDNERAVVNGLQISKSKALENIAMSQRIETLPSERKRKSPTAEPADGKVACIDIEGKRISNKARAHDSAQKTEKVSATREANLDASLLKARENNSKPAISRAVLIDEGEAANVPVDDVSVDKNLADDMPEDDNLVINMVGGGHSQRKPVKGWRAETILDIKGAVMDDIKPSDITVKNQSSKVLASMKKRKTPISEAIDSKFYSINMGSKRSPGKVCRHDLTPPAEILSTIDGSFLKQNDTTDEKVMIKCTNTTKEELDFNSVQNQNPLQDFKGLTSQSNSSKEQREVSTPTEKPNAGKDKKPKKGVFWAQKSSWTNLVGARDVSFSISQLLPDIKFEKEGILEQPKNLFAPKP